MWLYTVQINVTYLATQSNKWRVLALKDSVLCVPCRLQHTDAVQKGWVLDSVIETRQQVQALSALGIIPKHCGQ